MKFGRQIQIWRNKEIRAGPSIPRQKFIFDTFSLFSGTISKIRCMKHAFDQVKCVFKQTNLLNYIWFGKVMSDTTPPNLRILKIFEIIADAGRPLTPTEINERLCWPKQSLHRLCQTLIIEGYLVLQRIAIALKGVKMWELSSWIELLSFQPI